MNSHSEIDVLSGAAIEPGLLAAADIFRKRTGNIVNIKFATTHCTKVDRIALVGDKRWEEWMAKVCKPFTTAQLRYFDSAQIDAAWAWLKETA